jgi:hypothetical protein
MHLSQRVGARVKREFRSDGPDVEIKVRLQQTSLSSRDAVAVIEGITKNMLHVHCTIPLSFFETTR